MIEIQLDTKNGLAYYRQIVHQIESGIVARRIRPGDQLPSVREMSKQLQINPLTVAKAYVELERDKWVITRWGKGTFVADRIPFQEDYETCAHLDVLIERFLNDALPLVNHPKKLIALIQERLKKMR